MSTVVTHQHGQARSVKIWVDENARRWPAQALRGFNAALVPISPTVWNMTLAGDVLGGGLFQSVALLPNGLSIEITHSQVESFSFTQLPVDPLTWSYVVARCPWVAAMPLVPTYEIVSAAAFDIETDCIIGLLRREGGHTPIFYSQVAGGHSWPLEDVRATEGLRQQIDFDYSVLEPLNGNRLAPGGAEELTASRRIPYSIRRYRYSTQAISHLQLSLWARALGGPFFGNATLRASLEFRSDGAAIGALWTHSETLVLATGTTRRFFVDVDIDDTAFLAALADDWDVGGDGYFHLTISRDADTYPDFMLVDCASIEFCMARPGVAF